MLGSLGGPEIILIFIVALIVFGPKRLPEIGRKLGEIMRELRRATGDFRNSMEREIGFDPLNTVQQAQKARRDILSTVSDPIREVAQGTIGAVREIRRDTAELIAGSGGGQAAGPEPDPAGAYPPDAAHARNAQGNLDFGGDAGTAAPAPGAAEPVASPESPPASEKPAKPPAGEGGPNPAPEGLAG